MLFDTAGVSTVADTSLPVGLTVPTAAMGCDAESVSVPAYTTSIEERHYADEFVAWCNANPTVCTEP